MSKRKFQTEVDAALASILPYLTLPKPKKKRKPTVTSFLLHFVLEEHLMKTNKLPPPPVVGKLPYIDLKLSWDGSQEFSIRAMLDFGANVPGISQSFVDTHKVPGFNAIAVVALLCLMAARVIPMPCRHILKLAP